jgi:hypothetical protein
VKYHKVQMQAEELSDPIYLLLTVQSWQVTQFFLYLHYWYVKLQMSI